MSTDDGGCSDCYPGSSSSLTLLWLVSKNWAGIVLIEHAPLAWFATDRSLLPISFDILMQYLVGCVIIPKNWCIWSSVPSRRNGIIGLIAMFWVPEMWLVL